MRNLRIIRGKESSKANASKIVQYYWFNIVMQEVAGCLALRDKIIPSDSMKAFLNQTTFLTQTQALSSKSIGEHNTQ